jgi:hypothetical protein
MARSSLTFIPDFSVKFFYQPIYTDYAQHAHLPSCHVAAAKI